MNARRPQDDPKRGRRSIAIITAGFIIVSAALHVLLGGAVPTVKFSAASPPSVGTIVIDILETPPPPTPAPHPSPTPKPTQSARVSPPTHQAPHPVAPRATIESQSLASAAAQPSQQPQGPESSATGQPIEVSPQPSAPADDRYVIVSARFEHEVHPDYPRDAADAGEEGTVIVLLTVGPQGPSDIRVWVSSGYPSLDRAALTAAQESTYSVPEHNGEPVTETYRVIYTFSLNA